MRPALALFSGFAVVPSPVFGESVGEGEGEDFRREVAGEVVREAAVASSEPAEAMLRREAIAASASEPFARFEGFFLASDVVFLEEVAGLGGDFFSLRRLCRIFGRLRGGPSFKFADDGASGTWTTELSIELSLGGVASLCVKGVVGLQDREPGSRPGLNEALGELLK